MLSRGGSVDAPGDPTAKAKAAPKAKAGRNAKAKPAAQGGSSSVELVTHPSSSSGSAAIADDKTHYGGRYDFAEGGRTQDGKVLIRKAVRTLLLLFERKFSKPFVVNNCISHANVDALNWPNLVHTAPSYFEPRCRHASSTGKPCSKNEMSQHIYSRLSRIQENIKTGKDFAPVDLILDISRHGDEPIALSPEVLE